MATIWNQWLFWGWQGLWCLLQITKITVVKCKNETVFHMDSGRCKPGNSSLPNSFQLYCNPRKTNVSPFPVNVAECPYPLQFSKTTGRCENFAEVNSGTRREEKYICISWFTLYQLFSYICKNQNTEVTVNQLLIACKNCLGGAQEPRRCEYYSLRTSRQISLVYYINFTFQIIFILIAKMSRRESFFPNKIANKPFTSVSVFISLVPIQFFKLGEGATPC